MPLHAHPKLAQNEPDSFFAGLTKVRDGIVAPSNLPEKTPVQLIEQTLDFILSLAAIISLGVFIWGAIRYMTSLGDESKAESAKKIMMYAIIGLVVTLTSYVIIRLVGNIIGVA